MWVHARYDRQGDGSWLLAKPTKTFVTSSSDAHDDTGKNYFSQGASRVFGFPCVILADHKFKFDLPDTRREIDWKFNS